jgi:hypothetical protein
MSGSVLAWLKWPVRFAKSFCVLFTKTRMNLRVAFEHLETGDEGDLP